MIRAEELRIGNYIKSKPFSIPRLSISSDGIMKVTGYGISVIESDTNDTMGFEAIPLTEEWLLTFGAKEVKARRGVMREYAIKTVRLEVSNSRNIYYKNSSRVLSSVHELQNLYFALKGQELEWQKK